MPSNEAPPVPRPTARKIWLSLPPAERRALGGEFAKLRASEAWPHIEKALAAAMGFRPATFRKASLPQLGSWLSEAAGRLPEELLDQMLVAVHFHGRSEVLTGLYDAFGVPHDGIEVEEEVLAKPLDPKKAASGAAAFAKSAENPEAVRTCLSVMRLACTDAWRPAVDAALAKVEAAGGR